MSQIFHLRERLGKRILKGNLEVSMLALHRVHNDHRTRPRIVLFNTEENSTTSKLDLIIRRAFDNLEDTTRSTI